MVGVSYFALRLGICLKPGLRHVWVLFGLLYLIGNLYLINVRIKHPTQ